MAPVLVQTRSSGLVNVRGLRPEDISIEDIAHSLSMICRFIGHLDHFYSVAQHSVWVSKAVPDEAALAGLLHDASEAFTGDIIKPIKDDVAGHAALEQIVHDAIAERFGVDFRRYEKFIRIADQSACATEARDLGGRAWEWGDARFAMGPTIEPLSPEMAKQLFLERFDVLTGGGL